MINARRTTFEVFILLRINNSIGRIAFCSLSIAKRLIDDSSKSKKEIWTVVWTLSAFYLDKHSIWMGIV